jgi:uncharacterized protein
MTETPPLERLLEVQAHDTILDQLRHRRDHLAERGALADVMATISRVEADLVPVESRRDDLSRSQRRLEDEIASLEDRARDADEKLGSGAVSSPRELQALQDSVAALRRRQRELEDEVLELMEESESVTATAAALTAERERLDAEAGSLRAAIAEAEVAIDGEIAGEEDRRAEQAAGIAPDLLATYEKLRARLDGVAVARLDGHQCLGCHLSLPATEVDQIKRAPADTVHVHEECGRILVRL